MANRKWQFRTREAAESMARELSTQRDHLAIALNAALHGGIEMIDTRFGTDDAYYTFGIVPRIAGCVIVVTFYAPRTGQKPHTTAYWESWVQEEIGRMCILSPDDKERIAYRDGLYHLRRAVNEANNRPLELPVSA